MATRKAKRAAKSETASAEDSDLDLERLGAQMRTRKAELMEQTEESGAPA